MAEIRPYQPAGWQVSLLFLFITLLPARPIQAGATTKNASSGQISTHPDSIGTKSQDEFNVFDY